MHKFIEYISDLLFLHDCVIIPDFGGFICNYKGAYIDEVNGRIYPPGKDIVFNKNLTHNDGLLVNWIACKENISYDKATKQVALFCEELKVRLNQRQRIAFGDIGVFSTDRRFNIIFESGRNNFLSETFGMEQIEVEKTATSERIKPKQIAIPTPPEMSPYINIESSNWLHKLLKYGVAAAVVAGIVVVSQLDIFNFSNPFANRDMQTNTTTVQPTIPLMNNTNSSVQQVRVVISPIHDYVVYDPINTLEQ